MRGAGSIRSSVIGKAGAARAWISTLADDEWMHNLGVGPLAAGRSTGFWTHQSDVTHTSMRQAEISAAVSQELKFGLENPVINNV